MELEVTLDKHPKADGAGQSNRTVDRVNRRGAAQEMGRSAEAMVSHLERGVVAASPGRRLLVLERERARVAICGLTTACRRRRAHSS